ncbi:MAG: hypothetical protein KJ792_04185 [Actinobacteria bacterium]|nr:hypothetical protein [Actinomycetota bacterium]
MAIKTLTTPYAMNAAQLTLGADDYTTAVTQAELQPQTVDAVLGIGGNKYRSPADWKLAVGLLQDDDPAGLLRYLFDHEGETVAFTLVPRDGGTVWSGSTVLSPASVGGSASTALATTTVTLEVIGKPVPTAGA